MFQMKEKENDPEKKISNETEIIYLIESSKQ